MSVTRFWQLTVEPFTTSTARPIIFAEFERLLRDLIALNFVGEIWVDGSFLTEKIDPDVDDVDFTVTAHIKDVEKRDDVFRHFYLHTLNGQNRYSPLLDTYICVLFPENDPRRGASKESYWANKWSVGWDDMLKGFAVIKLGENDVWFNLFT